MKKIFLSVVSIVLFSLVAKAQDSITTRVEASQTGRKVVVRIEMPVSVGEGSFSFDVVKRKEVVELQSLSLTNPVSLKQWVATARYQKEEILEVGESSLVHKGKFSVPKGYLLKQVNFATFDGKFKFSIQVRGLSESPSYLEAQFSAEDQDRDGFREVLVSADDGSLGALSDYDGNSFARPDQLESGTRYDTRGYLVDRGDGSQDWNCDGVVSLQYTRLGGYIRSEKDWKEGIVILDFVPLPGSLFEYVYMPPSLDHPVMAVAIQLAY